MIAHRVGNIPIARPMRMADLSAVFAVEIAAHPFPWTQQILSDCMAVGYHCWVLEVQGAIVGFAIMSSAVGESHLLNICVDPCQQRRGYGRFLLRQMIDVAKQNQAEMMFLEVRVSNRGALDLYEQEGFNQLDIRKDYYPAVGGREDAIVLARHL